MEKIYYSKIIFECSCHSVGWNFSVNTVAKEIAYEYWKYKGRKEEVVQSFARKLTDEELVQLLPYINANDFEPYRNVEEKWGDEGRVGYFDEVSINFVGMTNDYLPIYQHRMSYCYDEQHRRPYERLYTFLCDKLFKDVGMNSRGFVLVGI